MRKCRKRRKQVYLVRKRREKAGEEGTWSNQQRMQASRGNVQKTNKSATCQDIKHGHNRNFIGIPIYKTLYR